MFVYTVYPMSGVRRKQPARRVEPVSRAKAAGLVEGDHIIQNDITDPLQQVYRPRKITRGQEWKRDHTEEFNSFQTSRKQSDWERPIGELCIQNMLPLLLVWRRPRTVIKSDFIEKRLNGLRAIQSSRSRHRGVKR